MTGVLNSTAYEALDELGFNPVFGMAAAPSAPVASVHDIAAPTRLTYDLRAVAPRPAHAVAAVYEVHRPVVTASHSPAGASWLARRVVRAIGR